MQNSCCDNEHVDNVNHGGLKMRAFQSHVNVACPARVHPCSQYIMAKH